MQLNRELTALRYGIAVRYGTGTVKFGKKYSMELRTVFSGKLRYGTKMQYFFFGAVPYSFRTL